MAKHSVFPINQFPREILAEIFWNCLPGTNSKQMLKGMRLFSICSSWRQLALATPKLWTTVGMVIGNPDRDPSATGTQVVNTWLERSGTLPLNLYLTQLPLSMSYNIPPMSSTDPVLAQSILSAFYSHSSRWQDVNLRSYSIWSFFLPGLDTPLLRSFRLLGPRLEASHFPLRNSSRFAELSWPSTLDVPNNSQISWGQISCLKILDGMYRKLSICVLNWRNFGWTVPLSRRRCNLPPS